MRVSKPSKYLTTGDSHALTRRGDQPLLVASDEYLFDHFPGIVCPEEPLDVLGVENFEASSSSCILNPEDTDIAER
jgi:hypothetical protein